jgi:hypothetical protein
VNSGESGKRKAENGKRRTESGELVQLLMLARISESVPLTIIIVQLLMGSFDYAQEPSFDYGSG